MESGVVWLLVALFGCGAVVLWRTKASIFSGWNIPSPPGHNESWAPVNRVDEGLYNAVVAGDLSAVMSRLDAGADATGRQRDGISALGAAITSKRNDIVLALLRRGANPDAAALKHFTALQLAVSQGESDMVERLLEAGASLEFCHPELGSVLSIAMARGHTNLAKRPLARGAPPNGINQEKATALHLAAFIGSSEMVEALLNAGAYVSALSIQGGTALRAAADAGRIDVVKLLIAAGAAVEQTDVNGLRALDYAKKNGHHEVVRLLESAPRHEVRQPKRVQLTQLERMLPMRSDSVVNLLRESEAKGARLTAVGLSALEAPTAVYVARRLHGDELVMGLPEGVTVPTRGTLRTGFVLWKQIIRDSKLLRVVAAPAAPAMAVRNAVQRIAESPYALKSWSRQAATAAAELRDVKPEEVMAVAAHFPPGPPYMPLWDWAFRIQMASALVVSHMESTPWATSRRRDVLLDVLDGHADWSSTAVIIAMTDVVQRDPAQADSIVETFVRLAVRDFTPAQIQHVIRPAASLLIEFEATPEDMKPSIRTIVEHIGAW